MAAPGPGAQDALGTAHGSHPAPVPLRATVPPARTVGITAVALRSDLERLLGAHVLLADELVHARLQGQEAHAAAATDAVGRNQHELVGLVTSLSGAAAADVFRTAWAEHVEVLGSYATALQEKDTAAQSAGRTRYIEVERELGAAFGTVVGGEVSTAALTAAATLHGEHLLTHADAFAAGDFDRAYTVQREAFGHMITIADVLARGIAAAKALPTAELDAPRQELQSALSRLLAEHMGLMVQAMRAAHDWAPEFPGAGRALNANTADLGGAVGTLYGEPASKQFLDLWAHHVESLVQYAGAAEDDPAAQQARQQLEAFAPELARFLAGATEQRLPAINLAAAITEHDEHLLAQADAYAAGEMPTAQQLAAQGYVHMFKLAQTLATAIGDTVAARLPQGGPATGGGLTGRQ